VGGTSGRGAYPPKPYLKKISYSDGKGNTRGKGGDIRVDCHPKRDYVKERTREDMHTQKKKKSGGRTRP